MRNFRLSTYNFTIKYLTKNKITQKKKKKKGQTHILIDDFFESFTKEIRGRYIIFSGIHPINSTGDIVDGDSIRPFYCRFRKQFHRIGTIQISPIHTWIARDPVCPEHVPT